MTPVLRTRRLTLREFHLGDLDDLAALVGDEEQMRFWPRPKTRDEASAWIERNVELYARRGFGVWSIEHEGEFAGYCGIRPLRLDDGAAETDMAWHVRKSLWRRGLATEAAAAARDLAFGDLGLRRLVAIVHPDHVASRRVAERIGMRLERAATFEGEPVVLYAMMSP